jgi:hypothetical protein
LEEPPEDMFLIQQALVNPFHLLRVSHVPVKFSDSRKKMQAAAVIAQIENLQRETVALLESLNIDGKPQEKLVEKLDSLYASIEQLESQLDGTHIPQLTDGQIRHHIKSK